MLALMFVVLLRCDCVRDREVSPPRMEQQYHRHSGSSSTSAWMRVQGHFTLGEAEPLSSSGVRERKPLSRGERGEGRHAPTA